MFSKKHQIGIMTILTLSFLLLQLSPAMALVRISKSPIEPSIDSADSKLVADAQAALEAEGVLCPVEGEDTNVVSMAQAIVDEAASGIIVNISSSYNDQVDPDDGAITFGKGEVSARVTFTLSCNNAFDTFSMRVVVPARIASDPKTESPVYTDDFESGRLESFWNKEYSNKSYSMNVQDSQVGSGNYALRAELKRTDADVSGSKRSEIALPEEEPLEEHYYSFSTYLPDGGTEDYAEDTDSGEIIAQWHNVPDPGEEWTCPPLALGTKNGGYYIRRYWDSAEITTTSQMKANGDNSRHELGSYEADKGQWVDWTFHIKWGWLASQDPILEVYKDGELVLDCNGLPNTTNDQVGVYMKVGLYKWDWKDYPDQSSLNSRVIYFDNIEVY